MIKKTTLGIAAAVAAVLVLAVVATPSGAVEAQGRGHGLTGTWYWSVPSAGASGFYVYNQDGTLSGVAPTIFGTASQPTPGTLHSSDYGVWRRVGRGFEAAAYRMAFDPATGDVQSITRIRTLFELDRGRESTSGTFFVSIWVCLTPVSCPDPNVDPPTVPEFAPPDNTWTQTRVRLR